MRTFKEQEQLEKEIITKFGGTEIKTYALINNTGYTFKLNNYHFDARHWRNCYGATTNMFIIHCIEKTIGKLDYETQRKICQLEQTLNENIGD